MIHNTRGIVLRSIKYSDSSIIVKVYTELFGLQSYIIRGARGKKAKSKANIFQPLNLVELTVYYKEGRGLNSVRESKIIRPLNSISDNIAKSSIAIFLSEVLYNAIKEEEANLALFEYLNNSIQLLDLSEENCNNFHLYFLVHLTRYLGFFPNGQWLEPTPYFNLQSGEYQAAQTSDTLSSEQSSSLSSLSKCAVEDYSKLSIARDARLSLLDGILAYYKYHLPSFADVRSHLILHDLIH